MKGAVSSRTKAVLTALLPRGACRWLQDRLEDVRRHRPPPHRGLERLGLLDTQVYPAGTHFDEGVCAGMARALEGLVVGKDTPVASIGSCFANEFASYMREAGFNYVTAEHDVFPASANWGRVYTIPGLSQIVNYSTDDECRLTVEESAEGWFDPLRESAIPPDPSREAAELAIRRHRAASRRAFAEARVLIVTLGQNEAWTDTQSGLVWARVPGVALRDADRSRFEFKEFSFEDDTRWLEDSLARLRRLNPSLDVLLTVSPVASSATFCDAEVVTHSFAGKCLLRAVAERVARRVPRVWYFPAFEMTLAYNPYALNADNRH